MREGGFSKFGRAFLAASLLFAGFSELRGQPEPPAVTPPDAAASPWKRIDTGIDTAVTNLRYINGEYFILGSGGLLYRSSDLENWTRVEVGAGYWLDDIGFGGGTYIVLEDGGRVYSSTDPGNWVEDEIPVRLELTSVVWGDKRFVAVGWGGGLMSRNEGRSWQPARSYPSNMTPRLQQVAYGLGKFVAVGSSRVAYDGNYYETLVYSEDGAKWLVPETSRTEWLSSVCFGENRFVTVGNHGRIFFSDDGTRWEETASPTGVPLQFVTYGQGLYIACGWFGKVLLSRDGASWGLDQLPDSDALLMAAAAGHQGVAVLARDGTLFLRSNFSDLSAGPSALAEAGTPDPDAEDPLEIDVVALRRAPYVFEHAGHPTGYNIELWEAIAREMGLKSRYTFVDSFEEVLRLMTAGKGDVAMGGLSADPYAAPVYDFSFPDQAIGFRTLVLRNDAGPGSVVTALGAIFSLPMLIVIGTAILLSIALTYVMHSLERHVNPDFFGKDLHMSFRRNLFWSLQTLVAHNCGVDRPKSLAGSILTIVWMLTGVIFTAHITAIITTQLTVSSLQGAPVQNPGDLSQRTVATVEGTNAETWLIDHGVRVRSYPQLQEAVDALMREEVDAVVDDVMLLNFFMIQTTDPVELVGPVFGMHSHAHFLRKNSPYTGLLNTALNRLSKEGYLDQLSYKWFGKNLIRSEDNPTTR